MIVIIRDTRTKGVGVLEKESESEERRGAGQIVEQTQVVVSLCAFRNRFVWSPLFGLPGSKVPQPLVACLARRTETVSPAASNGHKTLLYRTDGMVRIWPCCIPTADGISSIAKSCTSATTQRGNFGWHRFPQPLLV
jgi:hypothetical protein